MEQRTRILSLYRKLLRSTAHSMESNRQVRQAFRSNAASSSLDAATINAMLQDAQDKLGYLKIVGPRRPSARSSDAQSGRTRYVMQDGKMRPVLPDDDALLMDAAGRHVRDATPGTVDVDSLRRHRSLMDRFRFKGPTWSGKR